MASGPNAALHEPLIRPFMPELDTARGIAVLGVALLHAFNWQYAGLSFGPWGQSLAADLQDLTFQRHPELHVACGVRTVAARPAEIAAFFLGDAA